jgi:hypothetical protein
MKMLPYKSFLLLLVPLVASAADPAPVPAPKTDAVAIPASASPAVKAAEDAVKADAAQAAAAAAKNGPSKSDREDIYEKNGMEYAKGLYLTNDGTPEDETRSRKGDALNQSIRQRGIDKLESHLVKTKDKRVRREILHRLSQMYEQQADLISRRVDVKNKQDAMNAALRASNRHLEALRAEYPSWSADAVIFNLAENHTKLKEDKIAEKYYREVISNYPKSPVVADSLLSLSSASSGDSALLRRSWTASSSCPFPSSRWACLA